MKLIVVCIFMLSALFTLAQENPKIEKKTFKTVSEGFNEAYKNVDKGDKYYKQQTRGTYGQALVYYTEALKYNADNAALNYKTGVCYLESVQKNKALTYLLKAANAPVAVTTDIHYQLARAYHYNYKFTEAITEYKKYLAALAPKQLKLYEDLVKRKIEECNNGIELMKDTAHVLIENIAEINSEYPEYGPLISADESVLIFTSRRPDTQGGRKTDYDDQFYEDIYISYNRDGKWTSPANIGSPLNTYDHDATIGLSNDGQKMFTYYYLDIYVSTLKGDKWLKPESLPGNINSHEMESSASFSYDGKTIYFTRGKIFRPYSNSDIYVSHLNDNDKWGDAQKLSSVINSPYDEDAVFIHPDGKTLYFSSKGHNSMGGFDIFKSTLLPDSTWSKPVNLGYPVNTPDDDIYFVMAANGKHGYYSSLREGGKGFNDIYKITFGVEDTNAKVAKADTLNIFNSNVLLTLVKGRVLDKQTGQPIEAVIEIYDNETKKVVMTVTSNSATGEYLVSLPSGKNYGMAIKRDGYLFYSENFNLDSNATYQEVQKIVEIQEVTNKNATIVLRNLFFDSGKADLKPESELELERVYELMVTYPALRVEISGHTDNTGSYQINQQLSTQRAKSVTDYLLKKGINETRIEYKGYASDKPIADNKQETGKAQNRRVEFKVIGN